MNKRCFCCGRTKAVAAFSKNRNKRDGLCVWCKDCAADYNREYRRLNHKQLHIKRQAYDKANPEKTRAVGAKYRKANLGHVREYSAMWRKAHPDKHRDTQNRRRAIKKDAIVEVVSCAIVYKRDKGICHICGRAVFHHNWHLDHIVPLSKGGEHSYRNVAVAHPLCNMRKGAS